MPEPETGAAVKAQVDYALMDSGRTTAYMSVADQCIKAREVLAPCLILTAEEAAEIRAVIGDCSNQALGARERARRRLTPDSERSE